MRTQLCVCSLEQLDHEYSSVQSVSLFTSQPQFGDTAHIYAAEARYATGPGCRVGAAAPKPRLILTVPLSAPVFF